MISPFVVDESLNLEVDPFLFDSGTTNDTQKGAVLLHLSGSQVREIFSTLEITTTYAEACTKLDEYFLPKKNVISERWYFQKCKTTR